MIAKHVLAKRAAKSNFSKLVKYMIAPLSKNERVGEVTVTNCESASAEVAILEVLNTQAQNRRAQGDKTYHLMISFANGEFPASSVLQAIEKRVCAVLGFSDHQRVSAVHHDTDNLHVHIAINKIHPTRYTMHEPFNAYFKLGQICTKLEAEFGLEKVNHTATKSMGESLAMDMERNGKVDSLIGWVKRECAEQIHAAKSWADLHRVLGENGLSIKRRGNGLVIVAENGVMVKASSISRDFSRSELEERLGSFMPRGDAQNAATTKKYGKRPIASGVKTDELFARYTSVQQQSRLSRADEWAKARARKNRLIEDTKRSGRLKRAAIKLISTAGTTRKLLYAVASKSLRDEIGTINQVYRKERQEIYQRFQRRSWADWLRAEALSGDAEALNALRDRSVRKSGKGNSLHGMPSQERRTFANRTDSVTSRGTVIYASAGCAIRDDGERLQISRGADRAGLQAALRMAVDRYGVLISVNGSAAFRQQIAAAAAAANLNVCFDDTELELRRQQLTACVTTKEKQYEQHSNPGRAGQRRARRARREAVRAAAGSRAGSGHGNLHPFGAKSHPGKSGQAPPPESRNRVRELSELGMVHVAQGGEVLLPGHVPNHMEHKGPEPHHQLRRDLRGPGILARKPSIARVGAAPPPSSKDRLLPLSSLGKIVIGEPDVSAAELEPEATTPKTLPAEKYVFEREQKRCKGFDIPKHSHYSHSMGGVFSYAGIRVVDGQALVLLLREGEISVLEIDSTAAKRLKRKALGVQLSVSATGGVTAKGRGR